MARPPSACTESDAGNDFDTGAASVLFISRNFPLPTCRKRYR